MDLNNDEANNNVEDKKQKKIKKVDRELQYKSIYLNSFGGTANQKVKDSCDLTDLDSFLKKEKEENKCQSWNKLNKTNKIEKIKDFFNQYSIDNKLNDNMKDLLYKTLMKGLENKKFSKVKDIIYNKEEGTIKDIPGLFFNKLKKNFTIRNNDNRVSTSKNLAPKTKKSKLQTKKNKSRDNQDELSKKN